MTVNVRILGRFSTSMNSPREAGPFETRLEYDDSDWTMTDNMSRTLKTTFAVIEFVRKKILFLPVGSASPKSPLYTIRPCSVGRPSRESVITIGLSFTSQTTLQLNVHKPDFLRGIFSGEKPPNPCFKRTLTSGLQPRMFSIACDAPLIVDH